MENPGFLQRLEFLKKSLNLPGNFPNLEKLCFASEFFFVLVKSYSISPVSLQRHHEKSVVPAFLRSLLITYLIILSQEKILNFGSNICTNPENLKRRDHRLRAVSLFSWSVEQNARDTQMTTRVTEDARRERLPPSFLASRGFAVQLSRVRTLPLLNLKKRETARSLDHRLIFKLFERLCHAICYLYKS